jgi:hypothetical protein
MRRWKLIVVLVLVVGGLSALGNAVATPPWYNGPRLVKTWCANAGRVRELQAQHHYGQAVELWKSGHYCTRGVR